MENGRENGLMEGPVEEYHRNGQLRARRVYSQGRVVDSVVVVMKNDGSFYATEEWKDGRCRCYNANHRLISEYGLLNGKRHGHCTMYQENGDLLLDITLGDNGPEGLFARYYHNGKLREKCYYTNGVLDGEETIYFEDGTLHQQSVYKMGLLTGKSARYHENGQLLWEREFENGIVKDGSVPVYNNEGALVFTEIWENGIMRLYDADGSIMYEGGYMNFKEVGPHTKYHRNGQVYKKMHYSMGRLDGVTQIYDEYGNLYCEIPYDNDRREGLLKTYNPDGTVETESLYADDQYCGGKEFSYEDGVLRAQCEMNCELPEGEELEFHENGTIASKSFYKHGMPVDGRYEYRDENGNPDGYYEYKNGEWRLYGPEGELRMEWHCYRNHCNGSCHINDPEGGCFDGYMMDAEPCETLDEFLDMTFDLLAAKCAERFGDIHSEDDFKEFFAGAYNKAVNSIAAQVEYDDYAELEACFTRNLPDDRYVDYLVREFVLRLRLPNDGDTERDIAQRLREMVGM
jgi:antitoxin component YwqK of YwqJK toxin-antitoxin module